MRTIYQAEAMQWLATHGKLEGCSLITSLPDISEFPKLHVAEWKTWFQRAAQAVLQSCPDEGVTIFYQSDICRDGIWIDKGFLIQQAAAALGIELIAHKIVCRVPAGITVYGRAGYSHLLCFSKSGRLPTSYAAPDVLPVAGEVTWTRGMGWQACLAACQLVKDLTPSHTIVDPFCGHGSVLAVANAMGFKAIGVDLSQRCARKARTLTYPQTFSL